MGNSTFTYRVLSSALYNDKGEIYFDVLTRELAMPEGGIVKDTGKFKEVLVQAMEMLYHNSLANAEASASENLRKAEDNYGKGKATLEDVQKARMAYSTASKKYASYPSVKVCEDKLAVFVACAITTYKLVNLKSAETMISILRNSATTPEQAIKAIQKYFSESFNPRIQKVDYLKPYKCKISEDEAKNLLMFAQVYTLRWTKKGIDTKYQNDRAIWSQVVLHILRDAFELTVTKDEKKKINAYEIIV